MRKSALVLLAILVACTAEVRAQSTSGSEADKAAIKQTALDYIEGWYEGDAERTERALHPELAKRIVRTNPQGQSRLDQMSAMSLVQGTRRAFHALSVAFVPAFNVVEGRLFDRSFVSFGSGR